MWKLRLFNQLFTSALFTVCLVCLQELVKYTGEDHPDHAHVVAAQAAMKEVALLINEQKRRIENMGKIGVWQRSIEGWKVNGVYRGRGGGAEWWEVLLWEGLLYVRIVSPLFIFVFSFFFWQGLIQLGISLSFRVIDLDLIT